MFLFIWIFNFFHQCLIVFSVYICPWFNLFLFHFTLFFDVIVNEMVLYFFSISSLLMHRNTTDFSMLILYLEIYWILLLIQKFCRKYLQFSMKIMSSSNSACMLSNFSRIWLFATPQTVTRQVPLSMGLYCKDTGVGSHFLLQGNFPTQASNHVFCGSCIGRWILYYWASWEAHLPTETILFLSFWFRCLFFFPLPNCSGQHVQY